MSLLRTSDSLFSRVLLIVLFFALPFMVKAQLTVTTAPTPVQLVQNTLLGAGVNVSNINFTGNAAARGRFNNGGATNLGLNAGVILSSGNATGAIGPNSTGATTSNFGGAGDPFLNTLVAPNPTLDAAILEFDFAVASDSIRFKYVFGSEEYNEWVNFTYNDVFGFFLSGPGITGQKNLAIIPGTTTPVSINNVNNGVSPTGVPPTGPCTNCAYYTDNTGGTSLQYDGKTTVLTAKSNVTVCELYHIRLAIADAGDGNLDSGVFLEENSFSSFGNINITASGGTQSGDSIFICPGNTVTLCAAPSANYTWSTGATTQCITVTTPGQYSCFTAKGSCFAWSNQFYVVPAAAPSVSITASGPTELCPGTNVTLTANSSSTPVTWSTGATTQSITVYSAGTYTATVVSGGTCATSVASINITAAPSVATITPSGPTTLCPTNAVVLTANSGSSYAWSNGATTQSIMVSTAGSYTVNVFQSGGCSAISAPINVIISQPLANITVAGNPVLCPGSNVTLQANNGSSWIWSNGATTQNITVNAPGNFTVQVSDSVNCVTTSTNTNITQSNPTASVSITGNTLICPGDSVILSANSGSAYLWTNGATSQNITVFTSGNFGVNVTNLDNCNANSNLVNVALSVPTAVATLLGNSIVCPGQTSAISANSGSSWLWSNGATTQTINAPAGSYSVSVSNADGCTANSNTIVINQSIPAAWITASGAVDLCPGENVLLSANPGQTYLWSNGATTSSITISSAGTYTVEVTNTDNCPAISSAVTVSNLTSTTDITASGPTHFCPGENVILTASPASSWLWSNGETTQSINVSTPGNYNVSVVNSNNCPATAFPVLVTLSNPNANIIAAGNTTLCPGENVSISANPGTAWLWSNGATTQNIIVNSAGAYSVQVTNADGCIANSNIIPVIESIPLANISASGSLDLCSGESVTLTANPGTAYLWSNGATAASITVSTAGSFTVQVTNADNCFANSNLVSVSELPAFADISASGPLTFCEGGDVTLIASSGNNWLWSTGETTQNIVVNSSGNYSVEVLNTNGCIKQSQPVQVIMNNNPIVEFAPDVYGGCSPLTVNFSDQSQVGNNATYLWNFGDGNVSTLPNPIHHYPSLGLYTVQLIVTSSEGCIAEQTKPSLIEVSGSPVAFMAIGNNAPLLFSSSVQFSDSSAGATSRVWYFGDGARSDLKDPVHTYEESGKYLVRLEVENQYGCEDVVEKEIYVYPFYLPNAFSPNDDGYNETFYPFNFNLDVASFDMKIYNRWGQLVFSADDPKKSWTGKDLSGKDSPVGVYVVVLDIKTLGGFNHQFKTQLTLIR